MWGKAPARGHSQNKGPTTRQQLSTAPHIGILPHPMGFILQKARGKL